MKKPLIIYLSLLAFCPFCLLAQNLDRGPQAAAKNQTIGKVYALIIGISNYADPNIIDLNYADDDAKLFLTYLKEYYGNKLDYTLLIEENAITPKINEKLREIKKNAKPDDLVIIYFAGHGENTTVFSTTEPTGIFLCHQTIKENILDNSLRMADLAAHIKGFNDKNVKVIFVADACHSGATDQNISFEKINESQSIRIYSSTGAEVSIEDQTLCGGHGYFTYFLIKGLLGAADKAEDGKKDGKITVNELHDYVRHEILHITKNKQTPVIFSKETNYVISKKVENPDEALNCLLDKNSTSNVPIQYTIVKSDEDIIKEKLKIPQQIIFNNFLDFLKKKQFLSPDNQCAKDLYQQLKNQKIDADIFSMITQKWHYALVEYAQGLIGKYTQNEKIPTYDEFEKGAKALNEYLMYLSPTIKTNEDNAKEYKEFTAKKVFLEAYAIHRKYTQYQLNISKNEQVKLYKSIIESLKYQIQLNNDQAYLYNVLGRFYRVINDIDNAELYYKLASGHAKKWIFPKWNLLDISMEKYDNIDKHKILEEFIKLKNENQNFIEVYLSIAQIYYSDDFKEYDKATSVLDEALKKADYLKEDSLTYSTIYNNYGINYWYQKKYDKAETSFKEALKWSDERNYDVSNNLAEMYIEMKGDLDYAITICKKPLTFNPENGKVFLKLGNLYKAKGDIAISRKDTLLGRKYYQESLENYQKSLQYDAYNSNAYYTVGQYYLGQYYFKNKNIEDKDKALEYTQKSYEVESNILTKRDNKIYYAYLLWENQKTHPECLKVLNDLLKDFKVIDKNTISIRDFFIKRAKEHHHQLYYLIGMLYDEGIGGAVDKKTAYQWYLWALQTGFEPAASKILNLYTSKEIAYAEPQKDRLKKARNTKRFTVPAIANNETKSFWIYTDDYPLDESQPLNEEINRLKFLYNAVIKDDVLKSFNKLFEIARKNDVSYGDLVEYAIKKANTESTTEKSTTKPDIDNEKVTKIQNYTKSNITNSLDETLMQEVSKYENDFQAGRNQFLKNIQKADSYETEKENYYKMGLLYETSLTDKSSGKAIKWYSYAFQMGYEKAYDKLKKLYQFVSESKVDWLKRTYDRGFDRYDVFCLDDKGNTMKKIIYLSEYPTNLENPLEKEEERLREVYQVKIQDNNILFFSKLFQEARAKNESFLSQVRYYFDEKKKSEESDKPDSFYESGRKEMLKEKPNYDVAINYFKKAIEVDNKKANYYFLLAVCQQQKNDFTASVFNYQKAIQLEPERGTFHLYLGDLYIQTKEYPKAKLSYERAYLLGENKNKRLCYNLACIHSLEKRKYNALRFLEEALENGFNDFDHIAKDTDLEIIRNEDSFQKLIAKYKKI